MSGMNFDTLMSTLPPVLRNDIGMNRLGQMIARETANANTLSIQPLIYVRIEELDEGLLDILAKDFKVDWYDFDASVEVKRRLIKDSFYVHRHMGTAAAVKRALSDVWPPSTLEEWFEYDGEPYYFRIILEATSENPINVDRALMSVQHYKSVRSHLENSMPIIRISFGIIVETEAEDTLYHVSTCGTKPRIATHGDMSREQISIESESVSAPYQTPVTGELVTGTYPNISTHGEFDSGGMQIGASASETVYTARVCGTSLNSLF